MTLLFEPFGPLFEFPRQVANNGVRSFVPAADLVVTDDDVSVVMYVPGLTTDDVTIELREDGLTGRGERPLPYRTDDQQSDGRQLIERGFGTFERMLRLLSGLDRTRSPRR